MFLGYSPCQPSRLIPPKIPLRHSHQIFVTVSSWIIWVNVWVNTWDNILILAVSPPWEALLILGMKTGRNNWEQSSQLFRFSAMPLRKVVPKPLPHVLK